MDSIYKLEVDADQMCRACLSKNTPLSNLFCSEIVDGDIVLMPVVFETVTGLQIQNDDGFPSQICDLCRQKIIDAYIIRGKCVKSATLLRKILNIAEDSADAKEIVNSVAVSSPPHDMLMQTLDDTFAETEDSTTVIEFIGEMSEPDDNHTTDDENTNDDSIEMLVFSEDSNIKTEMIEINGDLSYTDHVKQTSQKAPKQEKELCKICGAIETRDNIDAHLKTHDDFLLKVVQQAQFYRCDSCRVIYLTVDEFAEHLSDMNNCQMILRQYTDAHCTDYQFLDDPIAESLAGISIISGAMSKNRAYMCYCGFESFEIADFVEHFRNDHANDTIELLPVLKDTCRLGHMCGICSATQSQCHTFDNMKDAILHVFCHRDEFECVNTCRRAFRTLKMLRRHWQREHSNNDLIFSCQHCQQMFANNDELKKHTKQECKGRKLSCIHCPDKKYFHKQALEVHMRKHSEDKRFKCDHCPKKFVQSNDLKNHLRIHTGERPYQCGLCDKSFKTISCRLDHLKTHDTDAVVKCTVCDKSFKSDRILRGHMRLHSEKSFSCEVCLKKFYRQYHLKSHMKVHQEYYIYNTIE